MKKFSQPITSIMAVQDAKKMNRELLISEVSNPKFLISALIFPIFSLYHILHFLRSNVDQLKFNVENKNPPNAGFYNHDKLVEILKCFLTTAYLYVPYLPLRRLKSMVLTAPFPSMSHVLSVGHGATLVTFLRRMVRSVSLITKSLL